MKSVYTMMHGQKNIKVVQLCLTEHINILILIYAANLTFSNRERYLHYFMLISSLKKAATIAECVTRAILHVTNIMNTSDKKICVVVLFTYPHITPNTYAHITGYSVSAPITILPNSLPLHSRHPTHYSTMHNVCLIRLVIQHVTQNDDLSYFCDKTTFTVHLYIWIFI
jgi:hypothetical protein